MSAFIVSLALVVIWWFWRETYTDPASVVFLAFLVAFAVAADLAAAIRARK